MKILVGSAWPYTDASLHIGQISAWLPADVIARYHRAKGDTVYYVSGSDCHGEPVAIRARQTGCRPQEISDCYHAQFKQCFRKMGFSFDCYTKTSYIEHKEFVRDFHRKLYRSPYVYEKDALDGEGKQLYIALSQLRNQLENLIRIHPQWGENVIAAAKEYIEQGFRDMPLTTNLEWGIDVPHLGFEDKRIYVWAENVLGYLSASKICAERRGEDFSELWSENAKHYYVYGKDNIFFHTVLLPGMLAAHTGAYKLPDQMVAADTWTINDKPMEENLHTIVWMEDLLKFYPADTIRYYFLAKGPKEQPCPFSKEAVKVLHNQDLVGKYGNFINRIMVFIERYYRKKVPMGSLDSHVAEQIKITYQTVGALIEEGKCKEALHTIFLEMERESAYLEKRRPWKMLDERPEESANILYNSLQVAANISVMLFPFLPFSAEKVLQQLSLHKHWNLQTIEPGYAIGTMDWLFEKIE